MHAREIEIDIGHLRLAARAWGDDHGEPVLALHGWLDNAASFDRLAPLLEGLHLVALDLPGHGRSEHRPPGAVYHFVDWIPDVVAVADALGWQRWSLLGHSMGAGIASLVPAAVPGRVRRLVLLEGAGPLSTPAAQAAELLQRSLAEQRQTGPRPPRTFPDLDSAVAARRAAGSDLDREAARLLVERGTEPAAGGLRFRHDPRLRMRSRLRFTEEQVLALLDAIDCPVLAIRARQGWPFTEESLQRRLAAIPGPERIEVEGGHHVHLVHPERVASAVEEFLLREQL